MRCNQHLKTPEQNQLQESCNAAKQQAGAAHIGRGVQNAFNILENNPLDRTVAADSSFKQPEHVSHKPGALHECHNSEEESCWDNLFTV